MTEPEVTVVIPAYNSEATIGRAIGSAVGQTFGDFEILVVDDGSTDGTASAASAVDDSRIRIIRRPDNQGEATARNTGIRQARGSFVAWLDADDEWLPSKLERQLAAFASSDEGVGAYSTGSWLIQGDQVRRHLPSIPRSWTRRLLLGSNLGAGTTLLARRSAFEQVGLLDERCVRHADWDWMLRLVQRLGFRIVREPLVRIYRGSLPSGSKVEQATLYFLEKHADTFKLFGPRYRRKAVAKRWLNVAWYYYYMPQRNLAKEREYFTKAVRTYPLQKPHAYLALLDALFNTRIWLGLANAVGLRKYHR